MNKNLKKCPRFEWCSINICPLDFEQKIRIAMSEEKSCPFTIKKRLKSEKGITTIVSDSILRFIPKSNQKMLNKRNLKRFRELENNE